MVVEMTEKAVRANTIADIAQRLKDRNPYPEDVFPAMKKSEIKEIVRVMKVYDFNPDRYAAHLMRIAWLNAIDCVIQTLDD